MWVQALAALPRPPAHVGRRHRRHASVPPALDLLFSVHDDPRRKGRRRCASVAAPCTSVASLRRPNGAHDGAAGVPPGRGAADMNHSNHDRLGALVGRNRSALGHGLAARASGDGARSSLVTPQRTEPAAAPPPAPPAPPRARTPVLLHLAELKYAFGSVDSFSRSVEKITTRDLHGSTPHPTLRLTCARAL